MGLRVICAKKTNENRIYHNIIKYSPKYERGYLVLL